ncbi:MAG: lycopene cyclase domain-containing protein [Candidatus Saccharimonadales bacterium]
MYRYLIINLIFCLPLAIVWFVHPKPKRRLLAVLLIMLSLTAIFDSLIIAFDIVGYNQQYTAGLVIIKAPIEDFFYTVVATVLTISLWERYSR